MSRKENIENLINKWSWLLEGLSKAQYKKYKYSRIFDNSSKCKEAHYKIILPIAHRLFKKKESVNVSRSEKNTIDIIDIDKTDIDAMDLESYIGFLDAVSDMIVEKMNNESINSLYRLKIKEENESYKISISN